MARKGDDIQERLVAFAVRVIRLCDDLPQTYAGEHIARQLLRSGTAPAAHHGEARNAESPADFIHKLKIASKELSESEVWMRIVIGSGMQTDSKMAPLLDECGQLQKILNASIRTSRKGG